MRHGCIQTTARRRRAALIAGLVVASIVAAPLARAAGEFATQLSTPGWTAQMHTLASNARGDQVAAWAEWIGDDCRIAASTRSAEAAGWSAPIVLRSGLRVMACSYVEAAIAPTGEAVVAWWRWTDGIGSIEVSARDGLDAIWTAPELVVTGPMAYGLALDAAGNATIAWADQPAAGTGYYALLRAKTRPRGGSWSPAADLVTWGEVGLVSGPQLVPTSDGTTLVGFVGRDQASASDRPYVVSRASDGSWSQAIAIGPTGSTIYGLSLAAGGDVALAAWARETGGSTAQGTPVIVVEAAARRGGSASWEPPVALSPPDLGANGTAAAVSPLGKALVAWHVGVSMQFAPAISTVWASSLARDGNSWEPATGVAAPFSGGHAPSAGFDRLGTAHVVWGGGVTRMSSRVTGQPWSPQRDLFASAADGLDEPKVAGRGEIGATVIRSAAGASRVIEAIDLPSGQPAPQAPTVSSASSPQLSRKSQPVVRLTSIRFHQVTRGLRLELVIRCLRAKPSACSGSARLQPFEGRAVTRVPSGGTAARYAAVAEFTIPAGSRQRVTLHLPSTVRNTPASGPRRARLVVRVRGASTVVERTIALGATRADRAGS